MKRIVLTFALVPALFAQKHELGLTLGGLLSQNRGAAPNNLTLSGGTALQANYGYRFWSGNHASLLGEVHFLANAQRTVASSNRAATRDEASIYITPGIRLKLFPKSRVSPYGVIGAGFGDYEQSTTRLDGAANNAPREIVRGVFDWGGGADIRLVKFIGLRGEIRDFYTGSPAYNLPGIRGGQHNVVLGGGFVLKWN